MKFFNDEILEYFFQAADSSSGKHFWQSSVIWQASPTGLLWRR